MQFLPALSMMLLCISSATSAFAPSLVGYWYGQGYQPTIHETTQFIARHREDGEFDIRFRAYKNCVPTMDQVERGTWSMVDAQTYRVVTTSVSGMPFPDTVDEYRIEEFDEDKLAYVHLSTGVRYSARRVDEHFWFPDCELISLK